MHYSHSRQSLRLSDYDYTQPGAYFVTIVAYRRQCLFGDIYNDQFLPNFIGGIIGNTWQGLDKFFAITLDEWILMPNHFHGIIFINEIDKNGRPVFHLEASKHNGIQYQQINHPIINPPRPAGTLPGSLGAIIQNFKSLTTRKFNRISHILNGTLWQRNYYDRIIRNNDELDRIREYILFNPIHWEMDDENPSKRS